MTARHTSLAAGRWQSMTLAEQLGNVGSEVYRARRWQTKDRASFQNAFERMLELMDLTITDPRWRRRGELSRVREVLCDYFMGGNSYRTEPDSLQAYFDQFAVVARKIKAAA
ncbi:MAG: hypothetical protein HYY50_05240 [Candidatus Kerfeldbacteria bacterium]|nr:hypothetical protein [Candidatus Kerfeldbacteria bacterium]